MTKQPGLFDKLEHDKREPFPHARTHDRATSHEATESVERLTEKQLAVYACLATFGLDGATDIDIHRVYENLRLSRGWPKQSDSGLRTRRNELFLRTRVEDVGVRKIGRTRHHIWRVI